MKFIYHTNWQHNVVRRQNLNTFGHVSRNNGLENSVPKYGRSHDRAMQIEQKFTNRVQLHSSWDAAGTSFRFHAYIQCTVVLRSLKIAEHLHIFTGTRDIW